MLGRARGLGSVELSSSSLSPPPLPPCLPLSPSSKDGKRHKNMQCETEVEHDTTEIISNDHTGPRSIHSRKRSPPKRLPSLYFRSLFLKDHRKHLVVITCTSSHSDATNPAPIGYLLGSLPCELLSTYPSPPAEDRQICCFYWEVKQKPQFVDCRRSKPCC